MFACVTLTVVFSPPHQEHIPSSPALLWALSVVASVKLCWAMDSLWWLGAPIGCGRPLPGSCVYSQLPGAQAWPLASAGRTRPGLWGALGPAHPVALLRSISHFHLFLVALGPPPVPSAPPKMNSIPEQREPVVVPELRSTDAAMSVPRAEPGAAGKGAGAGVGRAGGGPLPCSLTRFPGLLISSLCGSGDRDDPEGSAPSETVFPAWSRWEKGGL